MLDRCNNPKNPIYDRYGGRGITVCEQWADFLTFYRDMGPRPPGKSIDRIDNNGNYCPENCRWATPTEQARNRRSNVLLKHAGESMTIAEWGEKLGLDPCALKKRLHLGWSVEATLTTPSDHSRSRASSNDVCRNGHVLAETGSRTSTHGRVCIACETAARIRYRAKKALSSATR